MYSEEQSEQRKKPGNTLPLFGNATTMNINSMVHTNVLASPYFKNQLIKLKTYHEVVDEIYYKVDHLEPWEKGSRKTAGQVGMCGGVRGVGAGGIVSTAFCLLFKLFTLKLTRKQLKGLLDHPDSPFIRGLGFMYIRYCQPPSDYWYWYEEYLEDEEELDVKSGNGCVMTVGQMVRSFMLKLDWYGTLFPRIPVPMQKELQEKLAQANLCDDHKRKAEEGWGEAERHFKDDDAADDIVNDEEASFGEAAKFSQRSRDEAPARQSRDRDSSSRRRRASPPKRRSRSRDRRRSSSRDSRSNRRSRSRDRQSRHRSRSSDRRRRSDERRSKHKGRRDRSTDRNSTRRSRSRDDVRRRRHRSSSEEDKRRSNGTRERSSLRSRSPDKKRRRRRSRSSERGERRRRPNGSGKEDESGRKGADILGCDSQETKKDSPNGRGDPSLSSPGSELAAESQEHHDKPTVDEFGRDLVRQPPANAATSGTRDSHGSPSAHATDKHANTAGAEKESKPHRRTSILLGDYSSDSNHAVDVADKDVGDAKRAVHGSPEDGELIDKRSKKRKSNKEKKSKKHKKEKRRRRRPSDDAS